MPAGKIYNSGKKKVFTNRSLTRQVRALKGTEGSLQCDNEHLYNNTTLTANTGVIKYLDEVPDANANARYKKLRLFIRCTKATSAADRIRMCLIKDNNYNAAALSPNSFITNGQINGAYMQVFRDVTFGISSRNKNWSYVPRTEVVKDYLIDFHSNKTYHQMIVDVPLHNAKLVENSRFALYFQSTEASVVDVWYNVIYTDLND